MTTSIGRTVLTESMGLPVAVQDGPEQRIQKRNRERAYSLEGREVGAAAQPVMGLLEKDLLRVGALWCEDTSGLVVSGYYEVRGGYLKPGGRPRVRPWRLGLTASPTPLVVRQCETDNIAGSDTVDVGFLLEEDAAVLYTVTAGEATVLQPRTVSLAEKFNLPAGNYRATLRARRPTNISYVRFVLTDLAGTAIVTGAQVLVLGTTEYQEVDLGAFTVPEANAGANWYEVRSQQFAAAATVSLDRLRVVPV